ncbi:hypothetical protein GBAR_LOCUS23871 [Geodia barretti]|uniref:Uncharacterized protein n=1 Tax=Geodia barretti TaxID=519541 RepID=A0AA35T917_GEOBA|nr:hypothetical protein GBAR_LOCUS23871 [Geodia barretti]
MGKACGYGSLFPRPEAKPTQPLSLFCPTASTWPALT